MNRWVSAIFLGITSVCSHAGDACDSIEWNCWSITTSKGVRVATIELGDYVGAPYKKYLSELRDIQSTDHSPLESIAKIIGPAHEESGNVHIWWYEKNDEDIFSEKTIR